MRSKAKNVENFVNELEEDSFLRLLQRCFGCGERVLPFGLVDGMCCYCETGFHGAQSRKSAAEWLRDSDPETVAMLMEEM